MAREIKKYKKEQRLELSTYLDGILIIRDKMKPLSVHIISRTVDVV